MVPLSLWMGDLEPEMGPLGLKLTIADLAWTPPNHVNSLFSWNVNNGMLQHLIVRIENWPPGTESGRISPLSTPRAGCATASDCPIQVLEGKIQYYEGVISAVGSL